MLASTPPASLQKCSSPSSRLCAMSDSPPPSHQPIPLIDPQPKVESCNPSKQLGTSAGGRRKVDTVGRGGRTSSATPHLVKSHPSPLITAAEPIRQTIDPWNSSATGHQRSDNRLVGSTSWRASRSLKLSNQFGGGAGGGKRMYDTVGAGSRDFGRDGRKANGGWEKGAKGLRKGEGDLVGWMGGVEKKRDGLVSAGNPIGSGEWDEEEAICKLPPPRLDSETPNQEDESSKPPEKRKQIFQNLTIYINGSTAPLVGDHRLKHLLVEHGARISIGLGRRSVTHVILGAPNGNRGNKGAGGGLAGGKIQKEIKRVGGCGVKYVGVEWVLECIKAGKRVPEARFSNLSTAPVGVKSVLGMFEKQAGKA